jgi:phospholipase C
VDDLVRGIVVVRTRGRCAQPGPDLHHSYAWERTYLLGTQDVTSQLETPGGASLPELAPGDSLTLGVTMRATNAPPGDMKRIDFTLSLASDPTLALDAVQAVSQFVPDLVAITLKWNPAVGGLDFGYTNSGSALPNATTAKLFWASGPKTNDILSSSAIYTAHIPAGFSDQASGHVAESSFQFPPTNALYLQLVLDPDNLIVEATKTNNVLALRNTFRHVVVVMMENRSFDHLLGWLPGAEGMQSGKSYTNVNGQSFLNWHLTYFQGCGCDDPDHSYLGGRIELNTKSSPPASDGWLLANTNDTFSIGYYLQRDLPFLGQAATNWTVCDHCFAAIMAETQPNRIYQHAAQTDSLTNRTTTSLTLPTIWDSLSRSNISAQYYYSGTSFVQTPLALWGISQYYAIASGIDRFYSNCQSGTLPAVSFVDPVLTSALASSVLYDNTHGTLGDDTGGNDDHPHSDIRNGEAFLANVYNAVASSPNWSSTLLIVNFDEWGGFFDHVPPPKVPWENVPSADATAYNAVGITSNDPSYGLMGFRVPCIVISPWARKGYVATGVFDHTSVLKLIEYHCSLPNLTSRDLTANDLTNLLNFDYPEFSPPPVMSNVPAGPFGGPCRNLQIRKQPGGEIVLDWDATCIKVVIQTAPSPFGPWADQLNVIAPPYVVTKAQILQLAEQLLRFKVVQ